MEVSKLYNAKFRGSRIGAITVFQLQDFLDRKELGMVWDKEREPHFDEQGYFVGFLKRGRVMARGDHYLDSPFDPRWYGNSDLRQHGYPIVSNAEIVRKLERSHTPIDYSGVFLSSPHPFRTSSNNAGNTVSPEDSASMRPPQPHVQQLVQQQQQQQEEEEAPGTWRGMSGRIYTTPTGEVRGNLDTYHIPLHTNEIDAYRNMPDPFGVRGLSMSRYSAARRQRERNGMYGGTGRYGTGRPILHGHRVVEEGQDDNGRPYRIVDV